MEKQPVTGSGLQLHTQSSPGERSGKFSQNGKFGQNGKFSQNGKLGQNDMSGQKGKVHLGPNVSSSTHYRGCVHGQWQWCYGSNIYEYYYYYYYRNIGIYCNIIKLLLLYIIIYNK